MKKVQFESTGKKVVMDGAPYIGAWTDGIGVYSDFDDNCYFRLNAGKKYRVTIEEAL